MFSNTFNYLKDKLFGAKNETERLDEVEAVEDIPNEILLHEVDYSQVPLPDITNPEGEKTVLIVDDQDIISVLYKNDINKIRNELGNDIEKDFRVIRCLDKDSGLTAFKVICIDNIKIDYALLDLTLGCMAKIESKDNKELYRYAEVDGADLGIYIKEKNPDAKILFVTAHTMNKDNAVVGKYADKLKEHGLNLFDLYLSKNSLTRYQAINDLMYKK